MKFTFFHFSNHSRTSPQMSQAKLTSFEAETLHYKASTTYSFFNSMNMILPYTFTHMYANS